MPGQQQRKKSVRQKLNPVELEFKGKNVLLVDDSMCVVQRVMRSFKWRVTQVRKSILCFSCTESDVSECIWYRYAC